MSGVLTTMLHYQVPRHLWLGTHICLPIFPKHIFSPSFSGGVQLYYNSLSKEQLIKVEKPGDLQKGGHEGRGNCTSCGFGS